MSTRRSLIIRSAVGVLLFCAAGAEPALAESNLGANLGSEINSIVTAILLGVAGFSGLSAFSSRDFSRLGQIMAVVVVVGGFAFAGDQVKNLVIDLWGGVTGGGGAPPPDGTLLLDAMLGRLGGGG